MASLALLSALSIATSALTAACGNSTIPWEFDSTNHTNQTLQVNGTTRSFYVHIPSDYTPSTAHPVMISYHGFDETEPDQELISGFSDEGLSINNTGIIAVYPAGAFGPGQTGDSGAFRAWQGAPYTAPGVDDLAFTRAIVSSLQDALCVDPNRIYASGKSNGGGFVNLLMCSSSTNVLFAAFAPVSAALFPEALPEEGCNPGRQVPFINFHGLNDTVVPFAGHMTNDPGSNYSLPNITVWRQEWASRNGCPQQTVSNLTSFVTPSPNNIGFAWDCGSVNPGSIVHAYSVDGLEHSWPSTLPYDNGSTVHDPEPAFPLSEAVASFNATPTYIVPFLAGFSLSYSFNYSIPQTSATIPPSPSSKSGAGHAGGAVPGGVMAWLALGALNLAFVGLRLA